MTALLPLALLIVSALLVGATVLAIITAVRSLRERRITIFPVVRETETLRAQRALLAAGIFTVLAAAGIGGWAATQRQPENILRAQTVSTQTRPEISAVTPVVPTATPAPPQPLPAAPTVVGVSTIITPEPTVTPAPTAIPTETPTPRLAANGTPLPANLSMGPISFALKVSDRREAIDPAEKFNTLPERIYAVFPYSGMRNGLPFSVIWYYQDVELIRNDYTWEWGTTDRSFAFIKPVGLGTYRVELRVADTTVAENSFEITR